MEIFIHIFADLIAGKYNDFANSGIKIIDGSSINIANEITILHRNISHE